VKSQHKLGKTYTVSQKNVPPLLAISLTHVNGFQFFGRNVTDK